MTRDLYHLTSENAEVSAVVREVLGADPVEFTTVGALLDLLSRLPGDTLVHVADRTRVDPALDEGTTESCTVPAARAVTLAKRVEDGFRDNGLPRWTHQVVPGLHLGSYVVAEDRAVPASTAAYGAYDRATEARLHGDADEMLACCQEVVKEMGGVIGGPDDVSLIDWCEGDPDLQRDLEIEGERLAHAAARIGLLRARVVAHLRGDHQ